MTDQIPDPEGMHDAYPDDPQDAETTSPEDTSVEAEEAEDKPRSREQKYRLALRDAEMQRDQLAARLDAAHVREIEALATGLSQPSDLWVLTTSTVADYLTPEGLVDPDAVAMAVEAVLMTRPGLRRPERAVDVNQGSGGNTSAQPSWSDLLRD